MFDSIVLNTLDKNREELMMALLVKDAGSVGAEELNALRAAMEEDNDSDPGGKAYREASTALSLLLYFGAMTKDGVNEEAFMEAFAAVFPEKQGNAGAILEAGRRMEGTKKKPLTPDLAGEYEKVKAACEKLADWPLLALSVKRLYLNVAMRSREFLSLRPIIQELCGELSALNQETKENVVALCNEFSVR